jgi:hypothetical protein
MGAAAEVLDELERQDEARPSRVPRARLVGLGPCDLITADELAALLGCRKGTAVDWADARGLGLPTPGRGTRYAAGDVLQALRDDAERARSPKNTRPAPVLVDIPLAETKPHKGGPKRGRRS